MAVVGEEALSEEDRILLKFADAFEEKFITQSRDEDRSIEETLSIAWNLLAMLPRGYLKKIDRKYIEKYLPKSS